MASGHRGRGNQSGSERERPRRLGGLAARESVQFNNLPLSMSGKPSGAPWIALALLLEGAHDVDLPPPAQHIVDGVWSAAAFDRDRPARTIREQTRFSLMTGIDPSRTLGSVATKGNYDYRSGVPFAFIR